MTSPIAGPSQTSIAAPQWRQFTFFDMEEVKDSEDLSQDPKAFKDLLPDAVMTATSGQSPLPPSILVSSSNTISSLDRHINPDKQFRAWEDRGRSDLMLETGGLLVVIGTEEGSHFPVLKIWDMSRETKRKGGAGGDPVLMRNVRIQHGSKPYVTSMVLTNNLSHLAIGFFDGTVLLYRHLLQSLMTSPTSLTSLPKARVIYEASEIITGLGFRESTLQSSGSSRTGETDKSSASTVSLFITTMSRVLCAPVSGKGGETRTIDDIGCEFGCTTMDWGKANLIVARNEAIYLYGPEGRTGYFAYEGPKSMIKAYRHNLVIVSPPFVPTANSNSATVRHFVHKTSNGLESSNASKSSDAAKVSILDLGNELVAWSGLFRHGVRQIVYVWGGIFVYGGNGKLSRLDEHSTSAKLEVLYRRNLYPSAISLARSQDMGISGIAEIHKRYGDYLYEKGDFDGAMGQFAKTLGFLQPSYVIRKFLDAQRIHNLTTYLQELHSRGLANPDHTTLLLNCYTKTSDRARLDAFIRTEAKRSDESGGGLEDLPFDLDTAIKVCRQAGFYEHATYLAKKYGRHEEYLRIQIEDAEEYEDALRYLRSLGPEACQDNLVRYGKTLLQNEPQATTILLVDLCSGNLGKKTTYSLPPPNSDQTKDTNGFIAPPVLSYLGYNRVAGLFGGDTQSGTSGTSVSPSNPTDAESSAAHANGGSQPRSRMTTGDTEIATKADAPPESTYIPPSPRQYFAHFVDHHDLFIQFLEAVAYTLWNQKAIPQNPKPLSRQEGTTDISSDPISVDQRAIWNTLLELYLASTKSSDTHIVKTAKDKAMGLLSQSNEIPYDPMHALILCSTHGFTDGMVGLWESMGMYEDVLRFWMERDRESTVETNTSGNGSSTDSPSGERSPSEEVLRYLKLYGPGNPHLYPLVLRYLTSSPELLSKHTTSLQQILETIDQNRILPPLAIVQLLSRNGVASVGSVKEWLKIKVSETRQDVESDKALVKSYRDETENKQKEIMDLGNSKQPQVFQVTRCAACGQQLDLPAVHFMCKHSYHQNRCLSETDPECPLCARQHSVIREIRRNQTRLADRHDLFLNEVHEAEDGFGVVAGAYGRGLFAKTITEK